MHTRELKMIVLPTEDRDESIRFYAKTLGFSLKFSDGNHFAALDGGTISIALATEIDLPIPGQVVVGIKTEDVDADAVAVDENSGEIVTAAYNDAHEGRAVAYDSQGNRMVLYSPLAR